MKKVVIEFTPGSDLQDKSMTEAIMAVLSAWQGFYKRKHRKTEITITYYPDGTTKERV